MENNFSLHLDLVKIHPFLKSSPDPITFQHPTSQPDFCQSVDCIWFESVLLQLYVSSLLCTQDQFPQINKYTSSLRQKGDYFL